MSRAGTESRAQVKNQHAKARWEMKSVEHSVCTVFSIFFHQTLFYSRSDTMSSPLCLYLVQRLILFMDRIGVVMEICAVCLGVEGYQTIF